MKKTFVVLFLLLATLPVLAQDINQNLQPPAVSSAPAKNKPDLKLTNDEYNKLRIAELEMTTAQQELALLQARFKELQEQVPKMIQAARALNAEVLKAHSAEGGQVDMANRVIVPAPPKTDPKAAPKEDPKAAPKEDPKAAPKEDPKAAAKSTQK